MLPVPWYIILVLVIISFICCSIGAVAGFAGGVLMLPLYVLILSNYEILITDIIGSNAAGTFFTGLVSTILTLKRREINWLLALIFETPIFIGTYLGAFFTTLINEKVIATIFSCVIIFLAILLTLRLRNKRLQPSTTVEETSSTEETSQTEDAPTVKKTFVSQVLSFGPKLKMNKNGYSYTINILTLFLTGLVIGLISGLVGLGCGWAVPPVLIMGYGVPPQIAVSTSLFMTTITLLVNGITHIVYGHFLLWLWVIIASGSLIGGFVGTALKRRISGKGIGIIIAVSLVIISIIILLRTWAIF